MNIIDDVVITPTAIAAWREACAAGLKKLRDGGVIVPHDQVGTEEAYEQPDGALVIQCKAGEHTLHLRLEPKQWSHAN